MQIGRATNFAQKQLGAPEKLSPAPRPPCICFLGSWTCILLPNVVATQCSVAQLACSAGQAGYGMHLNSVSRPTSNITPGRMQQPATFVQHLYNKMHLNGPETEATVTHRNGSQHLKAAFSLNTISQMQCNTFRHRKRGGKGEKRGGGGPEQKGNISAPDTGNTSTQVLQPKHHAACNAMGWITQDEIEVGGGLGCGMTHRSGSST